MTNVASKFLEFGVNSATVYSTNNAANALTVNGWAAVEVTRFTASSPGFAAQLYTDGAGHYRVAMRGTDTLKDDVPPDVALATGQWHPQMTDAIKFMGEAILQIKEAHPELRLDDIRANIDGSGHSLGGALYELSAKFWGTSGMNIDGPGVSAQAGRSEFAGLKAEFRAKEGLVALQDNYTWSPGEFQARRYSVVGDTGTHLSGVEVYTSPQYTELSQAANDINSYYLLVPGVRVKHAAAEPMTKAIASSSWHPISEILKAEGYPNPYGALQEQYIARNLSLGLSASGYANGSMQYEVKGGGISFRVDVYRDDQGSMVEIRHAGRWVNGQFQILAPGWTTKATPSGMLINVGVDDPATGVSTPSVDSAAGLGTTRISANYITDNGAGSHTVTVGAGGTVSDIWLLQTRAGNDLGSLADFGRAIKANNPGITDINKVLPGQVIYVPQKQADNSVTYHYAGGASINTNKINGEYHMVVPNSEGGGQTVYSRTVN